MTAVIFLLAVIFFSCKKKHEEQQENVSSPSDPAPEYFAGGATTVFNATANAYDLLIANASGNMDALHQQGRALFFQEFAEYGTSEHDGLGPLFINMSCVGCHPANGRSQPPLSEIDYNSGLLMRFSISGEGIHGEPLPVPGFGTQLQNRAIPGVQAEGHFMYYYTNQTATYDDGSTVTLTNPYHQITDSYIAMPSNALYTLRLASPVYGLGLLEAVSDADILTREDETDENGDYISGKANYVWNVKTGQSEIGRMGWKASNPTVAQQTAGAFHEDMGITSLGYFPEEIGIGQTNSTSGFGSSPDIEESVIDQISYYIKTLGVPAPRNLEDAQVVSGKQIFMDIHCDGCHVPQLHTGTSEIAELSNQTIYPYTDLLLHDMGEVLADGRPDFLASTNEWRTPPLWGIGLTKLVNPDARFLHDGRAGTIEEAILWHGGEAHWALQDFKALSQSDREALIAFLNAL